MPALSFASPTVTRLLFLFVGISALGACGCNKQPAGPKRYEVSGTVKLNGVPVKKAFISLTPTEGNRKGQASAGEIINGEFHIPESAGPFAGEYYFQFSGPSDELVGEETSKGGGTMKIYRPLFLPKSGPPPVETRTVGPDSTKFDFDVSIK